jgi:mono/diheme cytochrome c family protein
MKKVLKWFGIGFASLVGLLLVIAFVMFLIGNARLNKTYDFPLSNIVVPTDAAAIERGKHRAEVLCTGCHGADLGGVNNWFAAGPLGTIDSANLTSGEGGIGLEFKSNEDYVRALRHGIDPEGKPIYMPAVPATAHLSDEDLGAIIAYLKTLPPVDRKTNGHHFTPLAKILLAAGMLGKIPVEAVSHEAQVPAPSAGVTVDYGRYLVDINDCRTCHGEQMAGGKHPDPTVKVLVPNVTPGGEPGAWKEADFITAIRTGITPSGHQLNPDLMPWKEYSRLTDDELKAIWLYLQSLPRREQASK